MIARAGAREPIDDIAGRIKTGMFRMKCEMQ